MVKREEENRAKKREKDRSLVRCGSEAQTLCIKLLKELKDGVILEKRLHIYVLFVWGMLYAYEYEVWWRMGMMIFFIEFGGIIHSTYIEEQSTKFRDTIPATTRLSITLHFSAYGDTFSCLLVNLLPSQGVAASIVDVVSRYLQFQPTFLSKWAILFDGGVERLISASSFSKTRKQNWTKFCLRRWVDSGPLQFHFDIHRCVLEILIAMLMQQKKSKTEICVVLLHQCYWDRHRSIFRQLNCQDSLRPNPATNRMTQNVNKKDGDILPKLWYQIRLFDCRVRWQRWYEEFHCGEKWPCRRFDGAQSRFRFFCFQFGPFAAMRCTQRLPFPCTLFRWIFFLEDNRNFVPCSTNRASVAVSFIGDIPQLWPKFHFAAQSKACSCCPLWNSNSWR